MTTITLRDNRNKDITRETIATTGTTQLSLQHPFPRRTVGTTPKRHSYGEDSGGIARGSGVCGTAARWREAAATERRRGWRPAPHRATVAQLRGVLRHCHLVARHVARVAAAGSDGGGHASRALVDSGGSGVGGGGTPAVPATAVVAPLPSAAARHPNVRTSHVTSQIRRTNGAGREQAGTHAQRYGAVHWRLVRGVCLLLARGEPAARVRRPRELAGCLW